MAAGRPEHPPAYPPTAASGPQPRFPAIASASAVWEVRRRRNPHFTGRDDVIADLRDKLVAERHAAVQALHGTGGIGKTQVALEYVYRFREHYDIVWWIDAEQADQIPVHYAELAARVGAWQAGCRCGVQRPLRAGPPAVAGAMADRPGQR
ncbi:hypothetical protein SGLAM104S_01517 [Streptomyces glaucescens]